MTLTNSLRTGATFLLGWAAGGSLIAALMYVRGQDALASYRAATDGILRMSLASVFDDARSAFVLTLAVGVLLPLTLIIGLAIMAWATARRRRREPGSTEPLDEQRALR